MKLSLGFVLGRVGVAPYDASSISVRLRQRRR